MSNQWFGFIVKKTENRNMMDVLETFEKQKPLCMVQCVDFALLVDIKKDSTVSHDFKIGDWVLSAGDCHGPEGVQVEPPFPDLDSALNYAHKKFRVNNFAELPS